MTPNGEDANSTLLIRAAEIQIAGGVSGTLVEISASNPAMRALAVVLDVSDSHSGLGDQIAALPALVESMPATWPVWCYRISEAVALNSSTCYSISDLREGRIPFSQWLERDAPCGGWQQRGSFIAPVLRAIDARRSGREIEYVTVVILSDGELLDLQPAEVPSSLRVIGVTPSVDRRKLQHWQRVLPGEPLCTVSDSVVDAFLQSERYPFAGPCDITWQVPQSTCRAYRLDRQKNVFNKVEGTALRGDLAMAPMLVFFDAPLQSLQNGQITCTSAKAHVSLSLVSAKVLYPLPPAVSQMIGGARMPQPGYVMDHDTGASRSLR